MKNWQPVFKNEVIHRAEIVKSVLIDHEIMAVCINKKDAYGFGNIEVHVQADHVLRALKIIKKDIHFEYV